MKRFTVDRNSDGEGLLSFLRKVYDEAPSVKAIKRAIDSKKCRINGSLVLISTRRLRVGDVIEIELDFGGKPKLVVLFEDQNLVVYDKPSGLVCDPKNFSTLLIHRLDKETSGVLLAAKNLRTKERFIELFSEGVVTKTYLAIVDGAVTQKQGRIVSFLRSKGRRAGQPIYGSATTGQEAITEWSLLATTLKASLLLCRPITGRTHQLRVHLKEIGHPILGDTQYCDRFCCSYPASRVLLHAWKISFYDGVVQQEFIASLPEDFKLALETLHMAQSIQKLSKRE